MGLYTSWMKNPTIAHTTTDIANWPNTVGGSIMDFCNNNHLDPDNHTEMQSIVHQFSVGAHLHWTWNPAVGCRSAERSATLLDKVAGGNYNGECGWLAWALYTLLTAPPPYGFGKAVAQDKVKTYSGIIGANNNGVADSGGREGEGFVSAHPNFVHNLGPNTYNRTSGALDLYKWGDHVVVKYNHRFYDPSYDAFYTNLYDMALYNVVQTEVTAIDPKNQNAGVNITWRARANGAGNDLWFRQLGQAERAQLPLGSMVIGPFAGKPTAGPAPAPVAPQVPPNRRRKGLFRALFCCWPW